MLVHTAQPRAVPHAWQLACRHCTFSGTGVAMLAAIHCGSVRRCGSMCRAVRLYSLVLCRERSSALEERDILIDRLSSTLSTSSSIELPPSGAAGAPKLAAGQLAWQQSLPAAEEESEEQARLLAGAEEGSSSAHAGTGH